MQLRTGVDLIEISRLAGLDPAIRRRFLQRVFTAQELADAEDREGYAWATLSGRFAVKEAVAKALRCGIGPISWQEIEVKRGEQGEPVLELHGEAGRLATSLGLDTWSISISHTRTHAIAMAVAIGSGTAHADPGHQ